jgi:hypothetical protein
METAILVVGVLILVSVISAQWIVRQSITDSEGRIIRRMNTQDTDLAMLCAQTQEIESVLKQASRLKTLKEQPSPFEGDKIPDKVKPTSRYVPVSTRRAQAERQSLGPATHDEKVRENNARAMETAG